MAFFEGVLDGLCGANHTIYVPGTHHFSTCFTELVFFDATHTLLFFLALIRVAHLTKGNETAPQPVAQTCDPNNHMASIFSFLAGFMAIAPIISWAVGTEDMPSSYQMTFTGHILSGIVGVASWALVTLQFIGEHRKGVGSAWYTTIAQLLVTGGFAVQVYQIIEVGDVRNFHALLLYIRTATSLAITVFSLISCLCFRGSTYEPIQGISEFLGQDGETLAGWGSKLLFLWVWDLLNHGYTKTQFNQSDLFDLPPSLDPALTYPIFIQACRNEGKWANTPRNDPERAGYSEISDGEGEQKGWMRVSMLTAFNRAFGWSFYPLGVLKVMGDTLAFSGPLLLNALVTFIDSGDEPIWHGYLYAGGLFLASLLQALINAHFSFAIKKISVQVRGAFVAAIYSKTLTLGPNGRACHTPGQIVDFMSTDTDRVVNFCNSFHQLWSLPVQIVVALYLLWRQIGLAFIAGVVFAIILIPINRVIAVRIGTLSGAMMAQKDDRVSVVHETLSAMRVVKFRALDDFLAAKIKKLRALEMGSLSQRKYLDAFCVYFWATTPVLMALLTLGTFVALGGTLTAANVFTSMALFNVLLGPLNAFPWVINGMVEASVSMKRVQKYLAADSIDPKTYFSPADTVDFEQRTQEGTTSPPEIVMRDCTFSWREPDPAAPLTTGPALKNVTLKIHRGELVVIVGKVGSGKSSLLHSMYGDLLRSPIGCLAVPAMTTPYPSLPDKDGYVGGCGFMSQDAWVRHGTVLDNILFGRPLDEKRYRAVIRACGLEDDIRDHKRKTGADVDTYIGLPGSDMSTGENGETLSGGQRARVALARAVYGRHRVYLLDDPLSALDAHVADHVMQHCIRGLLRGETVVLCTHRLECLRRCNVFSDKCANHVTVYNCEGGTLHKCSTNEIEAMAGKNLATESTEVTTQKVSDESRALSAESTVGPLAAVGEEEEGREIGAVKSHVYLLYWRAVGPFLGLSVLVSVGLMQASKNGTDWWLSHWVSAQAQDITPFIAVYGGLAAFNTVATLLRSFLFAYGGLCAARTLHDTLVSTVMHARMNFFDSTPVGRLLNRFSTDVYDIDDALPFILNIFLAQSFAIVGSLTVICIGLPPVLAVVPLVVLVYYRVQRYYRHTARELKRLETITRSPVYGHFSSTIRGVPVIRAMRMEDHFMHTHMHALAANQQASYNSGAISQWLELNLQLLGVILVGAVGLFAILQHQLHYVKPGLVGLAISYALPLTNLLSYLVTSFTETEKQMVSVERVVQYIDTVEQERDPADAVQPPSDWPSEGAVAFHDVTLVYRPGLAPALDHLTFTIPPGRRVGVCGRTGAGKSSLMSAVWRLVDLTSGTIAIDGLDISRLQLKGLRSRLSVITQTPLLFAGTLRSNLDPTETHQDADLWAALDSCHMGARIRTSTLGLDMEVREGGTNFSSGERQLLCLASALLTHSKVLWVDEATANVDPSTDRLLQQVIRNSFKDTTIVTIAHRVDTILDSDLVLVMSQGRLVEMGPPNELLANQNSYFASVVRSQT